jgi:hypothetical protein
MTMPDALTTEWKILLGPLYRSFIRDVMAQKKARSYLEIGLRDEGTSRASAARQSESTFGSCSIAIGWEKTRGLQRCAPMSLTLSDSYWTANAATAAASLHIAARAADAVRQ